MLIHWHTVDASELVVIDQDSGCNIGLIDNDANWYFHLMYSDVLTHWSWRIRMRSRWLQQGEYEKLLHVLPELLHFHYTGLEQFMCCVAIMGATFKGISITNWLQLKQSQQGCGHTLALLPLLPLLLNIVAIVAIYLCRLAIVSTHPAPSPQFPWPSCNRSGFSWYSVGGKLPLVTLILIAFMLLLLPILPISLPLSLPLPYNHCST